MNTNSTKRALLVIDVQQGFLTAYTRSCLPRIHTLLQSDRFSCVLATRFANPANSPFRVQLGWSGLSQATDIQLDETVERHAEVIIDKTTYGAGDELAKLLKERKITEVILVGIDTDVCVLQNAAQLFDKGFDVTVDLAGCATNGGQEAEYAARRLLARTVKTIGG